MQVSLCMHKESDNNHAGLAIGYTLLKMGCYFTGLDITPWCVAVVSMVTLDVKLGI